MSRVQPPVRPTPSGTPFGKLNACCGDGHVFAVAGISGSIVNHVFLNALENECALSVHVEASAARFTSFWRRHVYAVPCWSTCVVWAASAFFRPFTPSHPPYRLSKLWFSS